MVYDVFWFILEYLDPFVTEKKIYSKQNLNDDLNIVRTKL